MLSIKNILDAIAAEPSNKAKLAVLMMHKANATLRAVFNLALNPAITFGISAKTMPTEAALPKVGHYPGNIDTALWQLENVVAKSVYPPNSGELKRFMVEVLSSLPSGDREVVRRIIKGKLECGLGKEAALEVWPDLFPVYEYMGARPAKHLDKLAYPVAAQVKCSGVAVYAYCDGRGNVVFRNPRNSGKVYNLPSRFADHIVVTFGSDFIGTICCEGMVADAAKAASPHGLFDFTLGHPHALPEAANNAVWVQSQDEAMPMDTPAFLVVYDIRDRTQPNLPFYDPQGPSRWGYVANRIGEYAEHLGGGLLWACRTVVCESREDLDAFTETLIEAGHEGSVAKEFGLVWQDGKPKGCVKAKSEKECTLRVIGWMLHSERPSMMGSLVCHSEDDGIIVQVGAGWTDEERTIDGMPPVGTLLDVTFHRVSETGESLKLPRPSRDKAGALRIRADREKADTAEAIRTL